MEVFPMKKLFALLMITALLLGLTACGGNPSDNPGSTTTNEITSTAPELGSVQAFQHGDLFLEITNVASTEKRTGWDHGTDPYQYTVFTLYPGAQLRVINADMHDSSAIEGGWDPYAKWFISSKSGGEYISIMDGMPPVTITPDMGAVITDMIGLLVFEWFDATPAPEKAVSEQIYNDIFKPAIELYSHFSSASLQTDIEDEYRLNGQIGLEYYRVADPRFPTLAALENALKGQFSKEITQEIMKKTPHDQPIFLEHDGKLYTRMGDRGTDVESVIYSIETQSEEKIVYQVIVNYGVYAQAGQLAEETFRYTRELIDGKWVFTEFPMEWW